MNDHLPEKTLQLTLFSFDSYDGRDLDMAAHRGHANLDGVDLIFSNPDVFPFFERDRDLMTLPVPEPLRDLMRYVDREARAGNPELIAIRERLLSPDFTGDPHPYRTAREVLREHAEAGRVRIIAEGETPDHVDLAGAHAVLLKDTDVGDVYLLGMNVGQPTEWFARVHSADFLEDPVFVGDRPEFSNADFQHAVEVLASRAVEQTERLGQTIPESLQYWIHDQVVNGPVRASDSPQSLLDDPEYARQAEARAQAIREDGPDAQIRCLVEHLGLRETHKLLRSAIEQGEEKQKRALDEQDQMIEQLLSGVAPRQEPKP